MELKKKATFRNSKKKWVSEAWGYDGPITIVAIFTTEGIILLNLWMQDWFRHDLRVGDGRWGGFGGGEGVRGKESLSWLFSLAWKAYLSEGFSENLLRIDIPYIHDILSSPNLLPNKDLCTTPREGFLSSLNLFPS